MKKKAIIIGCGISGITLANVLANHNWKVEIYEKNSFIGGNCYDSYDKNGILIHNFGPHIFHTSNQKVIKFITKFTKLNGFVNKVLVKVKKKFFPLPINFKSMEIIMPKEAKKIIKFLKNKFPNKENITLFELKKIKNNLISKFVDYIYLNVYSSYTKKMWGTKLSNVNQEVINRIKIALNYDHNYFPNDKYAGLPIYGYTNMFKKMLRHKNIKVYLNNNPINSFEFKKQNFYFKKKLINYPLIYCGSIDELLNYKYGTLPYRSLNIKFITIKKNQFQKTAIINYPLNPKMTRIVEYKLMTKQNINGITTISKEYPFNFEKGKNQRFYPINNKSNNEIYHKYILFLKRYKNFYLLGRLAQYKYYDMDDAINQGLLLAKKIIKND